MPEGNGDYLSRFERMERTLDRIIEIQEVQARHLATLAEIQLRQADRMIVHDDKLDRVETLLAEMTEKVNFLVDREMRREGGPETHA
ncbi:MAG TPA: hypothetical protein VMF91_17205 [Bryobacteraceae bacterium]|nr:hypothetical protein [Bryobacteraceae bacterium]